MYGGNDPPPEKGTPMNRNRSRHLTAAQKRNVKVIASGLYGRELSPEAWHKAFAATARSVYHV